MPRWSTIGCIPLVLLKVSLHLCRVEIVAISVVHESLDALLLLPTEIVRVAQGLILGVDVTRIVRSTMLPTSLTIVIGRLVIVTPSV